MMIQYLYSKEQFFIDQCTAAKSDEKCLMTICMKRTRFGWKEYLDQHLDEHLHDEGAQLGRVGAQVRLSWSIYQEGTTSSGRHQIIHCTTAKPNLRCNPGLLQFSQFSFPHIFTHRPPSPARNGQCPSKVNRRPCEECRQG